MIKIFYQNDEYDLDSLIKGNLQTCCIFDDQLSDNKKIIDWFIRSRKKLFKFLSSSFIFQSVKNMKIKCKLYNII